MTCAGVAACSASESSGSRTVKTRLEGGHEEMSAILEEAIEEVRALPLEEQRQLGKLASDLGGLILIALLYAVLRKQGDVSDLNEMLSLLAKIDTDSPELKDLASRRAARATLAGQIRGKYRDVLTSSDEFNARKAAEIAREDRPR